MERFHILQTLGDGAFGTVFKAENLKTCELVAIKRMKKKFTNWEECINLREIRSLRKFNHPNIIKLKEVIKVKDELNLVFEFLEKDLLKFYCEYKEKGMKIPEKVIKQIAFQIFSGLAHIHKHGFFHRDMKPENILMTNFHVKLADFGLAREIRSRPPYTEYVSTRWYRAPEILLKSVNYNSPVDVFAVGCIVAELYTLSPLFNGASEIDQMYKICQGMGTPTQANWPEGFRLASKIGFSFPHFPVPDFSQVFKGIPIEAIHIILEMLKFDSTKRPTSAQILNHSYFADVQNEMPKEQTESYSENISTQKTEVQKKLDEIKSAKNPKRDEDLLSDDSDTRGNVSKPKPTLQSQQKPKPSSIDMDDMLEDDDDELEKELQKSWQKPKVLDRVDPVQVYQNERTSYSFKNSISSKREISSEKDKEKSKIRIRDVMNQGLSGIQQEEESDILPPRKIMETQKPFEGRENVPFISFDKKKLFEARVNHFQNNPYSFNSKFPLKNEESRHYAPSLEKRLSKEMNFQPFKLPQIHGHNNFTNNAQFILPPIRNTEKVNYGSLPPPLKSHPRQNELLEKYAKYKKY